MENNTSEAPASALDRLVQQAVRQLEDQGFSPIVVAQYWRIWRKLVSFAKERGEEEEFSEALVEEFFISEGIPLSGQKLPKHKRRFRSVIRKLATFAFHGYMPRQCHDGKKLELPEDFENLLEDYSRFSTEEKGIRQTALRNRSRYIRLFLHFCHSRGLGSIIELKTSFISQFISSQIHLMPSTVAGMASSVRSFLRYLYLKELLSEDLSPFVPKVKRWRHDRVPTVWKSDDIERLLKAVDRSSPVGKRDYAVILLACRLGLRAGDIRSLRLENIHWDQGYIEIEQSKTTVTLTLPLSDQIAEALIDYLRHGRPKTKCREVFIRAHAPYVPFGPSNNFYSTLVKYRRRAGIKLPDRRSVGMHTLRHTLATRLLQNDTPLETIASVMGHVSLDSTRIYTKVDIDSLRTAALDPEEVPHE
jgi:site-specific recombinase XerD